VTDHRKRVLPLAPSADCRSSLIPSSTFTRRNLGRWEFQVCNYGCRHFTGTRITQSSWSVASSANGCYSYPPSCSDSPCCFCHRKSGRLRRIRRIPSTDGHRDEFFEDSRLPRRHFGYCLIELAVRPPPKVVRNPLCSDLTLL